MPERLKAILDKITAWWKKFNTKQRSVLISIAAVVIVALVILGVVISRPTQVELVEAQSASEASTIKGVLEDNNISYEVDSKLVFFVNKSDEVNAIMALGDNGIPAQAYSIDNVTDGSFSTTEADKQKKYQVYLEDKLKDHLEKQSYVNEASVDITMPDKDGTILKSKEEATAAVTLGLKDSITDDQAYAIARLVATALGNDTTKVAGRLSMYLGHNVEYDDLVSYGIFGLIDAIDKFNLEKNVKFETYASLRIRGAILDQIRKMDWIPRTVRQRQRKIDEAIKNIELRTGKTANDADLAKELSISEDELCNWQSQLKVTNVVSLDEFDESGPEPVMDAAHNSHYAQPEEIVTQEELKTMLVKSLDNLTEKERRVIELYYYEDLTLKEISNILEVSESRVSQLHTKGLIKMRKVMGPYMNILTNA